MENRYNLKHFNRAELLDKLGKNEDNVEFLISNYFEEIYKFIKRLREAVKHDDRFAFTHFSKTIAEMSKSVCFELVHVMAVELDTLDISKKAKIADCIEELENELENIRDIISTNK